MEIKRRLYGEQRILAPCSRFSVLLSGLSVPGLFFHNINVYQIDTNNIQKCL